MQRNEVDLTSYNVLHKLTQKRSRINVRAKTTDPLEENIEIKIHVVEFGKRLLDMAPKTRASKIR